MARAIDAEKYMKLLKEQYLHNKSMGNSQAARAWQGAIQLLYDMPTLTPPNETSLLEFDVVDTKTGKYPDWERIARKESWAKGLVCCDIDGSAIREDGSLILLDECGNCASCPPDRFEIRRRPLEGEEKNVCN